MNYKVAVIPGDGIGPEIVREARKVLDKVGQKYGHEFTYQELLMGGCSIDAYGEPLTEETLEAAKAKVPEKLDVSNAIASTAARAFPVIFLILFVLLKNRGLRICACHKRNEHNERHGH